MTSPNAIKFTIQSKAHVSLDALLTLQTFIKDYHTSSDPLKHSGDIYEQESPAATDATTKFIYKSSNSNKRHPTSNKRKTSRTIKTAINKHLSTKKKRRKK